MTRLGNDDENPGEMGSLRDRRLVKGLPGEGGLRRIIPRLERAKEKANKRCLTGNGLLGQLIDGSMSYVATRHKTADLHNPSFYSPRGVPVGAQPAST